MRLIVVVSLSVCLSVCQHKKHQFSRSKPFLVLATFKLCETLLSVLSFFFFARYKNVHSTSAQNPVF